MMRNATTRIARLAPRRLSTAAANAQAIAARGAALGVEFYQFSFVDLFGVQRSKLVPASRVAEIAEGGAGFAGFAAHLDMDPTQGDLLAVPDASTLVALAPSDAPQIEVADGVEHVPTHQGVVPLQMRGHGIYAGNDRTIKLLNVKFVPGFPAHQRLVSSGRLEHDNTINGVKRVVVDSMNAAVHMRDCNGKTYYSFALDKSGCVTQLPCVFGAALRGGVVGGGMPLGAHDDGGSGKSRRRG